MRWYSCPPYTPFYSTQVTCFSNLNLSWPKFCPGDLIGTHLSGSNNGYFECTWVNRHFKKIFLIFTYFSENNLSIAALNFSAQVPVSIDIKNSEKAWKVLFYFRNACWKIVMLKCTEILIIYGYVVVGALRRIGWFESVFTGAWAVYCGVRVEAWAGNCGERARA